MAADGAAQAVAAPGPAWHEPGQSNEAGLPSEAADGGSTAAPAPERRDVAVDARCLQDERFRDRGIGQLIAALLAGRPADARIRLIGLVDPRLPPLTLGRIAFFDDVRPIGGLTSLPAGYLGTSTLTHSALPMASMLQGTTFCAAMVHDFIPLDHPEVYLGSDAARLEYAARLVWLRDHDRFYNLSAHTRSRLIEVLGVDPGRAVVCGVPLRGTLAEKASQNARQGGQYVLVSGGNDWRKNVETPIVAHARSALMQRSRIRMVVFGGTPPERQIVLADLHRDHGGDPSLLEFASHLPDEALAQRYAGAVVMVSPSRNEGFSMPIIEAAVQGCPVLVSACGAHMELVPDASDLFEAEDVVGLQLRMEVRCLNPAERAAAQARQAGLDRRFAAHLVCGALWADLTRHIVAHDTRLAAPAVARGARPSIAFITPMPPDRSGVADYSSATLAELGLRADVSLYTETVSPVTTGLKLRNVAPLSAMAHIAGRHDAVVSVIGNSSFHLSIFNDLMEFGGASIAHDSRMLNFYYELTGQDNTLAVAGAELGRTVEPGEISSWLADQRKLPALFLDEVARASSPMFVHSAVTADILAEHGVDTVTLPFAPYRVLPDSALTPEARAEARRRLRLPPGRMMIVTFGHVGGDRAIMECIWAVEMLQAWGVDAGLACVGSVPPSMEQYLRNLAASIGVGDRVMLMTHGVSERLYRTWLQAADFGIQLRTYRMGGLSGALLDCIAAGLPTVANDYLATTMGSPPWIERVPDGISAVLIAERLMEMSQQRRQDDRSLEARRALLDRRGFAAYSRRMLQSLGFDVPEPTP